MYSAIGRPSIPPERLLKGSLLMALYTVRSERICASSSTTISCSAGSSIWMRSSRASTIDLLAQPGAAFEHDVASEFFTRVVVQARTMQLLSDEHFTVYGTLVEAWASLKRFQAQGAGAEPVARRYDPGNPTINFHDERRRNATHQSTTDRGETGEKGRGKEAKLCYWCTSFDCSSTFRVDT